MKWPWVSRRAYDVVAEQCIRLEAQVDKLQDALTRMTRVQVGLPEQTKERKQLEPMPQALEKHIMSYAGLNTRRMMRGAAYRRHARGEPWVDIMHDVMDEETIDAQKR